MPTTLQMMRNQDLAMSQLENHPGGFQALRRMYTDVQEPMMQASIETARSTSGANSASSSAGAAADPSGAVPNPWAASQPPANPNAAMPNPWGGAAGTGAIAGAPSAMGAQPNPFAAMMGVGAGAGAGAGAAGIPGMGMPGMDIESTLQMMENPVMQVGPLD